MSRLRDSSHLLESVLPYGGGSGSRHQGEGTRQNDAVAATATTSQGEEPRLRLQAALAPLLRVILRERTVLPLRVSCAPRRSSHRLRDQVCRRQFFCSPLCLDVRV